MMKQAIHDIPKQFAYQPEIINADRLPVRKKFLLCGMGGSHLAGNILQTIKPEIDLIIHHDYNLPTIDLADRLVIISSYSGNTEETIDSLHQAITLHLAVVVISTGGKLLELAKTNQLAYVQLPDTGIQPRSAIGFSLLAVFKVMGEAALLEQASRLAISLQSDHWEQLGKDLAGKFEKQIPIIYASTRNFSLAYNWKIKLNETGKIPAFCNTLPELNHNEMNGFDVKKSIKSLTEPLQFIFLIDPADHIRVLKRMSILAQQYRSRGLAVTELELTGSNILEKIFNSLLLADWFAFYTAEMYGLESEAVPMVEEFKALMAE